MSRTRLACSEPLKPVTVRLMPHVMLSDLATHYGSKFLADPAGIHRCACDPSIYQVSK